MLRNQKLGRLVASCQYYLLVTTCSAWSTSCNKLVNFEFIVVNFMLVAIYHLKTCYNLLKQLAAGLWITSFDNQLATDLPSTSCRKPCEPILISACCNKSVAKSQQTSFTLRVFGCVMQGKIRKYCRSHSNTNASKRSRGYCPYI